MITTQFFDWVSLVDGSLGTLVDLTYSQYKHCLEHEPHAILHMQTEKYQLTTVNFEKNLLYFKETRSILMFNSCVNLHAYQKLQHYVPAPTVATAVTFIIGVTVAAMVTTAKTATVLLLLRYEIRWMCGVNCHMCLYASRQTNYIDISPPLQYSRSKRKSLFPRPSGQLFLNPQRGWSCAIGEQEGCT